MKVLMLVTTRYEGESLKPKMQLEVSDKVGTRWVGAGIAKNITPKKDK